MSDIQVKIKPLDDNFIMPFQAHKGDAGFDCHYAGSDTIELLPGERKLIPLGFAMEIPEGYEAQVRSRSGLSLKKGIIVLNSPGTIDSGWRGPCGAIIFNSSDDYFIINPGNRICQMVIAEVPKVTFVEVEELSDSDRGKNGYGSTGV